MSELRKVRTESPEVLEVEMRDSIQGLANFGLDVRTLAVKNRGKPAFVSVEQGGDEGVYLVTVEKIGNSVAIQLEGGTHG